MRISSSGYGGFRAVWDPRLDGEGSHSEPLDPKLRGGRDLRHGDDRRRRRRLRDARLAADDSGMAGLRPRRSAAATAVESRARPSSARRPRGRPLRGPPAATPSGLPGTDPGAGGRGGPGRPSGAPWPRGSRRRQRDRRPWEPVERRIDRRADCDHSGRCLGPAFGCRLRGAGGTDPRAGRQRLGSLGGVAVGLGRRETLPRRKRSTPRRPGQGHGSAAGEGSGNEHAAKAPGSTNPASTKSKGHRPPSRAPPRPARCRSPPGRPPPPATRPPATGPPEPPGSHSQGTPGGPK